MPDSKDPKERQMLLAIASQPLDTNTTFTTGGDVSRFQRSTVPGKTAEPSQPASNATAGAPAIPTGPIVRVARGNTVTVTPAGGK